MKDIPEVTRWLAWVLLAVFAVVAVSVLLGCSPQPRVTGNPKYDRDNEACEYEGVKAAAGARDYEVPAIRADVWLRCMRLRGWHR